MPKSLRPRSETLLTINHMQRRAVDRRMAVIWQRRAVDMVVDERKEEKANEGETPVSGEKDEGETLAEKNAEGETPFVYVEGGTPFVVAEGETQGKSVGVETPVNTEVQEPEEGGPKEVVDLVNVPEEKDSPVDLRESRRRARRSLLDEVDDLAQPTELEFLAPGAGGEQEDEAPGSDEEMDEAEEYRLAAERKCKGKHTAKSQPKRSKKTASAEHVEVPLPARTKVPYGKEPVGPSPDSESEYEEEEEQEEELNYERTEVWVTKNF